MEKKSEVTPVPSTPVGALPCRSDVKKKKVPLFTIDHQIEPMDVDRTFSSFAEFKEWVGWDHFGDNFLTSGSVGDRILMFWTWQPSLKKAREHKLEHVTNFFDDLDADDEYRLGDKKHPHDSKANYIVYSDEDYLLIYVHKMSNGFHTSSYKITVEDKDEDEVRALLEPAIAATAAHLQLP